MKVYSKIVLGPDFDVIEEISTEYYGPVALAGGGGSQPKVTPSPAGVIVSDLYKNGGPLQDRLRGILAPNEADPYRDLAVKRLTNDINAQYGARGLANSGIGLKAVTEGITNFDVNREENKANQAIQILGTGSSSGTSTPGSQPRGLFGLK